MKVLFGAEKLEGMTTKFVIQFFGYLFDKGINNNINVMDVKISEVDRLNQKTTVVFRDKDNSLYAVVVSHAKDMCCSNWDMPLRANKEITDAYFNFMEFEALTPAKYREPAQKSKSTRLFNILKTKCNNHGHEVEKILPKLTKFWTIEPRRATAQ